MLVLKVIILIIFLQIISLRNLAHLDGSFLSENIPKETLGRTHFKKGIRKAEGYDKY